MSRIMKDNPLLNDLFKYDSITLLRYYWRQMVYVRAYLQNEYYKRILSFIFYVLFFINWTIYDTNNQFLFFFGIKKVEYKRYQQITL